MFGIQCVLSQLIKSGPKANDTKSPIPVYIKIIDKLKNNALDLDLSLLPLSRKKNETVIGIIGKIHGIKIAANPPRNANRKKINK